MARIPLDHPRTPMLWVMEAYSRRKYGAVLQPGLVAMHNRRVLRTMLTTERGVAKWDSLPQTLQSLAVLVAAGEIGCAWCMDFGYVESHNAGVDRAKLDALPQWRAADVYTPLERDVMELASAMTQTPQTVTDEMFERLRAQLTDEQVVELVALVAQENYRSRINAATGLTSQAFKDSCDLRPVPDGSATTTR